MEFTPIFWFSFFVFIAIFLAIDLGVLNRHPKAPTFKEASLFTMLWAFLATIFCIFIYFYAGEQKALEFATGYIVELSLSMDNVFVFVIIFGYFKVDLKYQHRVLFWGVVGAIVMRFIMITFGIILINKFQWVFYLFGLILIFSAFKLVFSKEHTVEPEDNKLINFLKKHFKFTNKYYEDRFMVVENGKKVFTPMLLVLILVEKTDLIFAIDSIPAILAITQDPFIVFTSNIFAILGLRSLYFLLAKIVHKFVYLKYGLGFILAFIGVKMILVVQEIKIPISISLTVIIAAIALSVILSLLKTRNEKVT